MNSQIQTEIDTILTWLNSFPNLSRKKDSLAISDIVDGIIILEALNQMDEVIWQKDLITYESNNYSKANFMLIIQGLSKFYKKMGCQLLDCFTRKDFINPEAQKYQKPNEILNILELVLGVAVQCDNKETLINEILTNLDENTQSQLMRIIQEVLQKYAPQYSSEESEQASKISLGQNNNDLLVQTIEKLEDEKKKYLKNISDLESENNQIKQSLANAIKEKEDVLKNKSSQDESQQPMFGQKEMIDIEKKIERLREVESELEMKKHQLYVCQNNFDKVKKEYENEKSKLTEELEIEKELVLQLKKSEISNQEMKKKLENMKELLEKSNQQEQRLRQQEDEIYKIKQELSQKRNKEEAVTYLKEELSKEKSKYTQIELLLQSKKHELQDSQSELKIWQKKDELNQQRIKELQFEIDESKNLNENSFMSSNSLQMSIVSELELKINHLQSENNLLKMNNTSAINAKLIELESQVQEEQRQKLTFQTQYEVSQQRCKKLENECEALKLEVQSMQIQDSPKSHNIKVLREEKEVAIQRLMMATQKLTEMDSLQQQVASLSKIKEEQVLEIKALFQDKSNLKEEIFNLKDELNIVRNQLQERQIKDQYFETEKKMLESQIAQLKDKEKYFDAQIKQGQLQQINQADFDAITMKMDKERLKLENEMIQLQISIKNKEEALKIKEKALDIAMEDQQKTHQKEIKEVENSYEKELIQCRHTIQQLDDEVKMERQVRFELENSITSQEELTNSLIVNLGLELMHLKNQSQQQILQSSQLINNNSSVQSFIQKKRNQTYKTYNQ